MQKTVIELVDDIDGTESQETVTFSLDGADYQIDLSEENARRLRAALAEFVVHARTVTKPGKRGDVHRPTGRAAPQMSQAARREQNKAIRAWAREHGFQVPDRGRLAAKIVAAYHDAPPSGLTNPPAVDSRVAPVRKGRSCHSWIT